MRLTARSLRRFFFFFILFCCLLTATAIAAGEPVVPAELSYVDVELKDIFRDLAGTGGFRVLFAHPFQKRATMLIAPGSPVKKIIADIAANHGLAVKWVDANTAVIGDENSLAGMNTSESNLHVLPLRSVSPVEMAEVLETVLPGNKIRYDFKGNNIAVMASPLELENIKELVNRWDREEPILSVEIEVVEVTLDFLRELGIRNPASPQMKIYPIPERLEATIAQSTGKNPLVSYEVISLSNSEERLFFGDRVPELPEEAPAGAGGYRGGQLDVGTAVAYRFEVIPREKEELLLEVQARVDMLGGPGREPGQRELTATVGLLPGQTVMLTGALKRSEFLQMKTSGNELPFLSSLFAAAGANNDLPPDETATVIFLTPSFREKAEKTAERPAGPAPAPLKPAVSLVPGVPKEPPKAEVPVAPELPGGEVPVTPVNIGAERKETSKTGTTDIPYIVKKSETLYGIARKFGVSVQQIIAANNLKNPEKIRTGTTLIIPVPNEFIYTVKTDETLWRLAKRYGTTVAVLKDLNSLAGDEIKVGQKLVLPVAATKIANPQF